MRSKHITGICIPCVYTYWLGGHRVYIGFSKNIQQRRYSHAQEFSWRNEALLTVSYFDSELEARIAELVLIAKYSPKYNTDVPRGTTEYVPHIPDDLPYVKLTTLRVGVSNGVLRTRPPEMSVNKWTNEKKWLARNLAKGLEAALPPAKQARFDKNHPYMQAA